MVCRLLLCCGIFLFGSTALHAAPSSGKLTQVNGQVWVMAAGATERLVAVGDVVAAGSRVRTGPSSTVEITFSDGSLLRLQADSHLMLSGVQRQEAKSSLILFLGRLWSFFTRDAEGERSYEVKTANAVCGVRGTRFETAVADDGSVRVQVEEGKVSVAGESAEQQVGSGEGVDASDEGLGNIGAAKPAAAYESWRLSKRERLSKQSRVVVDRAKERILARKEKLSTLLARQKTLEAERKEAETRARGGDQAAINQLRRIQSELATLIDVIADIGDQAESQFGLVDHLADLAADPKFQMIDRKYLAQEAASLRRIKAGFDRMVQQGTDISLESMEKVLQEMGSGKAGTLRDKESAADDLFSGDEMEP